MNPIADNHRPKTILPTAIGVAAVVHVAIIASIGFEAHSENYIPPSLEVMLVKNTNVDEAPETASYLAQHSQQGGGESDLKKRPSALHNGAHPTNNGTATKATTESSPQQKQSRETPVLTQIFADHTVQDKDNKHQVTDTSSAQENLKRQRRREIARLTSEIAEAVERQAARPRTMYVTASTKKATAANYMLEWVKKVERTGNLNFPALSLSTGGSLVLVAGINKQGNITTTRIVQSSGSKVLDKAAIDIVKLAEPYSPMSPELARETDVIYITRTWQFNTDRSLTTR